jgi:hypothetical protein
MIFTCCENDHRRNDLRGNPALNGFDFLEVDDDPAKPNSQRQRALFVHFINELQPGQLNASNVRIDGGERIRGIVITGVTSGADDATIGDRHVLRIDVAEPGDFSRYTLRILDDNSKHDEPAPPPDGFDTGLSSIDFEFKAACENDFDCLPPPCPPKQRTSPDIDYLAKDYASFKQLLLDRMSALAPAWQERHPADVGVMLVEILAYAGDYLSYKQDAITTEAYLGTARRRASVRRHARLVDYPMHDGRNARAWIALAVSADTQITPGSGATRTQFLTPTDATASSLLRFNTPEYDAAIRAGATVFEIVPETSDPDHENDPIALYKDHDTIRFHTWGALDCCLPEGATQADLRDALPNLKPGHVLVLIEEKGPSTGEKQDADPAHRHAVRLTKVSHLTDPIGRDFDDPPASGSVDVTRVEWSAADALPFPLCISSRGDDANAHVRDVSVALGNIVLADHGATIPYEFLGEVPEPNPALTLHGSEPRCDHKAPRVIPVRFRPFLAKMPVTYAAAYDATKSASAAMDPAIARVAPSRMKVHDSAGGNWTPRPDLLGSHDEEPDFVVESETDGRAFLRFGDGVTGASPKETTTFSATYRAGNGLRGNVGADSLRVIASADAGAAFITSVRNPLGARGGIDPESIERVRQNAPEAFRVQERAVTTDDYADVARRCSSDIQRATARFRWTGSWRTVFLTVDRMSGLTVDAEFTKQLRSCLEHYRMAGHDLEVQEPQFVSLEIVIGVCVKRDYFATNVKAALRDVFSNRILPDGKRGFFHPDRFTFGQPVFLSAIYAAAQAVTGVDSVEIVTFQRQGVTSADALRSGVLDIGTLEIARLDNDPNFREHGVITFSMAGGR